MNNIKQDDEEISTSITPENYNQFRKLSHFKWRNITEGVLWGILLGYLILITPLVLRVKIILLVAVVLPIVFINFLGIKNRSVIQFICDHIRYRKNRISYHLRSVNQYDQKRNYIKNAASQISSSEGTSVFEKMQNYFKEQYNESGCSSIREFVLKQTKQLIEKGKTRIKKK